MVEKWSEIVGYEGRYDVSNSGKIRNNHENRLLPIHKNRGGYSAVSLTDANKKQRICLVHRLVAIAFLENNLNKPHVHHIDENKDNNNANNLMWVTPKEHGKLRSEEHIKKFRETYRRNLKARKEKRDMK